MAASERCHFGGDGCDQPAGHGRLKIWCAEHAALLAEVAGRRSKPASPKRAQPVEDEPQCSLPGCTTRAYDASAEKLLCWHHKALADDTRPRCLAPNCTGLAMRNPNGRYRATCSKHKRTDVPADVLAAWDAEHPKLTGRRKAVAA